MERGSTPLFAFTITVPEEAFPYSTDAIPWITSTLSTLSVVMVLRSIPVEGLCPPEPGLAPPIAADIVCMLAALEIGAPSMMMEVPIALAPRIDKVLTPWRSGLNVLDVMSAPGSRAITSASELAWMCSIAVLLIFEAVAAPALETSAVTVTSSRRKSAILSLKSYTSFAAVIVTLMFKVS